MTTEAATNRRTVRFEECPSIIVFDNNLSTAERTAIWHRPEDLKAQTAREVNMYRRAWTSPILSASYCWRGLEHRVKNSEAQKKKWWTFLKSFLKFQKDLKALDADVSNLLMVYASRNSQADRKKAQQMGKQDEAEAFKVYNEDHDSSCSSTDNDGCGLHKSLSFGFHLKSSQKVKQRECGRARSA